jgi:XTP/dITP diphosphohydrolase
MSTIILASDNLHKLEEINHFLANDSYILQSQNYYNVIPVSEDQLTFAANALKKATNAHLQTGKAALADDSGICVPLLNNAPGIYSARYAYVNASAADNRLKLLHDLQNAPANMRDAFFICCLAYIKDLHSKPEFFYGYWHGKIHSQERGPNDFGYNNIFYLEQFGATAAELSLEIRNTISHRAIALSKFKSFLCQQP